MEVTEEFLMKEGYLAARQLPNGVWIGLQQMMYTTGLFTGLDETGWRSRYCYEHWTEALVDFARWDGEGDPLGKWVKHKGSGVDRLNPRLKDEVF